MAVFSKWSMTYSTTEFEKTDDDRDLVHKCKTSEGVELRFEPNENGLHVMDCSKYFGIGKTGYVFGTKVIDNGTEGGNLMCNKYKRPTKPKITVR